jgi:hypothetical protein
MREAVIARPHPIEWHWQLVVALLICAAAAIRFGTAPREQGRMAVRGSESADTLGPREVDVITMRFEGLSVARVEVTAAANARLRCRVFDPNGMTLQVARAGAGCRLQWLVPRTGAYRIEVENRSASTVSYRTISRMQQRR